MTASMTESISDIVKGALQVHLPVKGTFRDVFSEAPITPAPTITLHQRIALEHHDVCATTSSKGFLPRPPLFQKKSVEFVCVAVHPLHFSIRPSSFVMRLTCHVSAGT